MAWFSEIAGKAEDFLNRVDQSAAVALQNSKGHNQLIKPSPSSAASFTSSSFSSLSGLSSATTHAVNESLQKSSLSYKLKQSAISDVSKRTSGVPKVCQVKSKDEEEKRLIEFLNSSTAVEPDSKLSSELCTSTNAVSGSSESSPLCLREAKPSSSKGVLPKMPEFGNSHDMKKEGTSSVRPLKDIAQTAVNAGQGTSNVAAATLGSTTGQDVITAFQGEVQFPDSCILQLQRENELLRNEVTSMNQEMSSYMQRAKDSEAETKRMQKKLEHWNSQVSSSDKIIREFQDRESDLTTALSAKDSQLAILRVRLQEADQELQAKREIVDSLRVENERLLKDHSVSSGLHTHTLEMLREKLQETEVALSKKQDNFKNSEAEFARRLSQLEAQQKELAEQLSLSQKSLMEERGTNKELSSQTKVLTTHLDMVKQELTDYKQKAQRILQSKEKVISTLKEAHGARNGSSGEQFQESTSAVTLSAEFDMVQQERDQLLEEFQKAAVTIENLRQEVQDLEHNSQNDAELSQEQLKTLDEHLKLEKDRREELDQECIQQKEELRYLREDLTRTKSNLQARIQDRDTEIEKLRKQLTTKTLSTSTEAELEARLHALTESLIQKQTMVEALSTEKNSLVLQLERIEQQVKDLQSHAPPGRSTIVGIGTSEDGGKTRLPILFAESPYDGTVARRVKRAYGVIDSFSVRLGLFLRRYPMARIFVILYMLLLHLWVMVVLLTYEPEIHGMQYIKNGTKD